MTWFKVDDGLAFHPKVLAAGNAAMGLWVRAGSWCAQQLTDGVVPDSILLSLGTVKQAEALAAAGLWRRREGAWEFHEWNGDGRQPTRASVEAERAATRERVRKYREGRTPSRRSNTVSNAVTNADVTPLVTPTPTRPDPTRPIESSNELSTSPRGDGAFAEFYMAYPRKVGKDAARKAFDSAVKRADVTEVIEGARRFAADPNLPEKTFIPHPATWLNRGGWEDEPMPPRGESAAHAPEDFGQDEWMHRA